LRLTVNILGADWWGRRWSGRPALRLAVNILRADGRGRRWGGRSALRLAVNVFRADWRSGNAGTLRLTVHILGAPGRWCRGWDWGGGGGWVGGYRWWGRRCRRGRWSRSGGGWAVGAGNRDWDGVGGTSLSDEGGGPSAGGDWASGV